MQLKKNPRDERYGDLGSTYPDQPESPAPEYGSSATPRSSRELDGDTEVTHSQPTAPAVPRAQSVVDADSHVDGKYETAQDLRILGSVAGEVICRGLLTIERDASAKAKIQARDVEVRGRLEGDVVASGRLLITSTGVVTGTIKAATLVVEEGATLRGNVETAAAPGVTDLPTPTRTSRASASKDAGSSDSAEKDDAEEAGSGSRGGAGRWNRASREVPSFALVSSEERASGDRN